LVWVRKCEREWEYTFERFRRRQKGGRNFHHTEEDEVARGASQRGSGGPRAPEGGAAGEHEVATRGLQRGSRGPRE
jgi:hypothetical protein